MARPARIAARALSANYAAIATETEADLISTLIGALVVRPYSIPEADWSFASAAGGIVNITDVPIKAAAGAGLRNYLTAIDISNAHATVATEVVIKDGASIIWRGHFPAVNVGARNIRFPSPLKSTANTALNVACITTGAAVYVNAQGYVAP